MKIITASLLESYGAFLPFYKVGTWRGSKLQIREKPLLTRYVLVNLPENAAWGSINEADGVNRVLLAGDAPARVPASDMANLMLAHAEGRYNVLSPRRDAAGRFRKHRKRRRRPRHGKILAGRGAGTHSHNRMGVAG